MKLKAPKNFGGAVIGGVIEISADQVLEDGSIEIEDATVAKELLSHNFTEFVEEDESAAPAPLTKAQIKKLAAEKAAAEKAEDDRIAAEKAAAEAAAKAQGN